MINLTVIRHLSIKNIDWIRASFVISFISLFFLSIQGVVLFSISKKVLMTFCLGGILFYFLFNRKFRYLDLLFCFPICTAIFFERFDIIPEVFILLMLYLISRLGRSTLISIKNSAKIGYFLVVIIIAHFYMFDASQRQSIGGIDPNYSSFLIFLSLPLAIRANSNILFFSFVALGLATASRTFLLAMIVYTFIQIFQKIYDRIKVSFECFLSIILFLFFTMLSFGYWILNSGYKPRNYTNTNDFLRVFNFFKNTSDLLRWKANTHFLQEVSVNHQLAYEGMTDNFYTNTVFRILPHNLPLLEYARHGIFIGSFFLAIFFISIKKGYSAITLPFYSGVAVYWLFLGIEVGAIYNIYFVSIILLTIESKTDYIKD